jgi:LPS sulfotransferase NodH
MPASYIIATTPRTGSFLLCEGLRATGIAGRPQEYADAEDVRTWRDHHGCLSHREFFGRFPELCRTPNGVFGAKLMWLQFVAWGRDARRYLSTDMSTLEVIRTMAGPLHIVHLVRGDVLRQAVSWLRAQATGIWSRRQGEPLAEEGGGLPPYDAERLRDAIMRLQAQNHHWDAVLALMDAPRMTVHYEALAAGYPGAVARVLEFLGMRWEGRLPQPVLQRQADEITEEWVERGRRDLHAILPDCRALT